MFKKTSNFHNHTKETKKLRLAAANPAQVDDVGRQAVRALLVRNKNLNLCASRGIEEECIVEKKEITEWFAKNTEGLKDVQASMVFNWDETMATPSKNGKVLVVTERSSGRVFHVAEPTRNPHVTLGLFICGAGSVLGKVQVIFPLETLPQFNDKSLYDHFNIHGQGKG